MEAKSVCLSSSSYRRTWCVGAISWGRQRSQGPSTAISPEKWKRKDICHNENTVFCITSNRQTSNISFYFSPSKQHSYTKAIPPPSPPFYPITLLFLLFLSSLGPSPATSDTSSEWVMRDTHLGTILAPGHIHLGPDVTPLSHGHIVGAAEDKDSPLSFCACLCVWVCSLKSFRIK